MTLETLVTSKTPKGQKFIPVDALWQVSIDQYHAMIESGVLTEENSIELLQGWLVQKMPKTPKHSTITRVIRKLLADLVPPGWYVDSQEPLTTADSEPEPDVMIIRGDEMDYLSHHPGPNDVALVVEVSDATLNRDKTLKKQLYAAAAVPIYWIVNIPDSQIEVYSQPFAGEGGANYQQQQTYSQAESVPVWIGETLIGEIPVAQLFRSSK